MRKFYKYFTIAIGLIICLYMLSACASKSYLQKKQEVAEERDDSNSTQENQSEESQSHSDGNSSGSDDSDCYIQISGAVNNPGVYQCAQGTRLFQLVDMAGGFRLDSYTDNLNLASEVYDGEKILIYTMDDANYILSTAGELNSILSGNSDASGKSDSSGKAGNSDASSSSGKAGQVNINTASIEELTTLTGIGETRAQAIIEYRHQAGGFNTKEELKNVSGIGESTYAKLADEICVN